MMSGAIHWANPELIWVLYGWLAIVVGLILLERRGSGALDRLVGSALQSQLVVRPSRWRRGLRLGLLAVAGIAMALAVMRPQMGERFVATPRVGAEIMIALDVSRSMLADDAKPTRLERSKAEIRDLLSYLGDDHVGLIAFAGRASVLSPMTPDKSFLRLALDGAGPHSVPRGGTKVAEAIRRAVVGFGEPGPAQRALILITDGEDHDSFALDAAKQAAEAGIKIIAIGFGDENGSAIHVRDPKTGARTRVVDGEGRPVISRLNGELLRSLALETDGAFVPAGTGVLDLASIYDAHISKLTRGQMDERGRTIRDEAYGLFLAIAFVCLISAVFLFSGTSNPARAASPTAGKETVGKGALVVILASMSVALATAPAAEAQNGPDPAAVPIDEPVLEEGEAIAIEPVEQRPRDPRERFNEANAALAAGSDEVASVELRDARRDATDDLELRYAATFNLGMAAMARADRVQGERPKEALEALHEAADWFREAVGMQPETKAPRHNLEVALRRATMLADELAQKEEGDLESALDGMIEEQRARGAVVAELLSVVAQAGELDAVERMRPAFEAAATEQRLLLSRAEELADRVVRDREAIQAMPEETRSPEDTLRGLQLEGVLVYLDGAIERMGGTRRQLRQRQAERAYRRGAAALGELKRARDQLRDPVDQIGVLLDETRTLAGLTAALLQTEGGGDGVPARPAFLSPASVEEDARRLQQRVAELAGRLTSASEQIEAAPAAAGPDPAAPQADPAAQEALGAALIGAAPLVREAASSLDGAASAVAAGLSQRALQQEATAGQGLADAQELFFDLTQLLEVAVAGQAQVVEIATSEAEAFATARDEYAPLAQEIERKNLERAARLAELLDRERQEKVAAAQAAVAQANESGAAPAVGPDGEALPDAVALETERFELADQLLALGEAAMQEADAALEESPLDWATAGEAAERSRARLEDLQTLFFTLIEHLKKLARDQVDVSDETKEAIALAGADVSGAKVDETREKAIAIGQVQTGLETRAGAIADALLEQSSTPPEGAPSEEAAAEAQEKMRKAAELVASAQLEMQTAASVLSGQAGALPTAEPPQTQAIADLAAAIELLSPPPPPQDEQQDQDQDQQQDQEQDSGEGEDSEGDSSEGQEEPPPEGDGEAEARETPEAEESEEDPSQLLQGVRDREAERRREKERDQQRRRSRPVDKDW